MVKNESYSVERPKKTEWPKLMAHKNVQIVVLFSEPASGTVVLGPDSDYPYDERIGFHCDNWDMDKFKPYDRGVKLQNV